MLKRSKAVVKIRYNILSNMTSRIARRGVKISFNDWQGTGHVPKSRWRFDRILDSSKSTAYNTYHIAIGLHEIKLQPVSFG